eukprot:6181403-Pleurochrysis_carterae.AAC.2
MPLHIVDLSDPTPRSCDACEFFGAMLKKVIKHLSASVAAAACATTARRSGCKPSAAASYTEQAFRRKCVRANFIHSDSNARYLQRSDHFFRNTGKGAKSKPGCSSAAYAKPAGSMVVSISADTVLTKAAAMAV